MKLRISSDLTLGANFVTSTQAILAQKDKVSSPLVIVSVRAERELRKLERARKAMERAESAEPAAVAATVPAAPRVVSRAHRASDAMSNLDIIAQILRARAAAMTVAEIVEAATGDLTLPTRSRTPRTVVARDLAIDVRDRESSRFVRVAPGTFALRTYEEAPQ